MTKSDLVAAVREKHREWELLLEEIGTARMDLPGVNGDWSFKDLVAHLTVWNQRMVNQVDAALRGEPEPPPPWDPRPEVEDDINAWIYESNHGRPVTQVLDDSQRMFQKLFTVIDALREDVKLDPVEHEGKVYHHVWVGEVRYPVAEFFDHYQDDHAPDVRAWLVRGA